RASGELRRRLSRCRVCTHPRLRDANRHSPCAPARPAWREGGLTMTRLQLALLLGFTAIVLCLPLFGSNYTLRLATIMLMYSTLALSWNFIGGFAGYPSFGLAAFFGLGAYSGGVLQSLGLTMVVAWLLAIALSAVFGLLLGGILLRLRGH